MKKFLVTYLAPASVLDDWKTEPKKRKESEEKMMADWKKWMGDHSRIFADKGAGVGKTKRVTSQGTKDARNDIILYAIVDAESHDAAAKTSKAIRTCRSRRRPSRSWRSTRTGCRRRARCCDAV